MERDREREKRGVSSLMFFLFFFSCFFLTSCSLSLSLFHLHSDAETGAGGGYDAVFAAAFSLSATSDRPITSTPEEFAAFTKSEIDRWGKIIKSANIKLD